MVTRQLKKPFNGSRQLLVGNEANSNSPIGVIDLPFSQINDFYLLSAPLLKRMVSGALPGYIFFDLLFNDIDKRD